ncbi:MAG: hypothetical protein J0L86_07430 [Flavobacteriales bacterium]|nr:hypothetical protein [Flavobacteriales bacterium]
MLKKHTFWFKLAIAFQFITGVVHSLSFLNESKPTNDSEKKLFDLMANYNFDFGAGFHHSMEDILNSFSLTFSLLLFFSATINGFLLKSKLPSKTLKGILFINLITYFICLITMYLLTFLPPIICIGLIVVCLLMSLLTLQKEKNL